MARPLRLEYPGAVYHITARGNERKKIYREEKDYDLFQAVLAEVVEDTNWLLHSYCLMPNHYHLLLETPEPNLSKGMRQLNGIYTQKFNYKHKRAGHLFQGRYKAIIVEKEAHLLELCRYVVLNPVRAGIVDSPQRWRPSSYLATIGKVKTPSFLQIYWLLAQFAKNKSRARGAYQKFVTNGIAKVSPLTKVIGQIYLGSEVFRAQIEETIQNKTISDEIPIVQRLPVCPHLSEVLKSVAESYQIKANDLLRQRTLVEERSAAIYLCRKLSGLDLISIANEFKISYSHVSRLASRARDKMKSDKKFRKKIGNLQNEIKRKYKT